MEISWRSPYVPIVRDAIGTLCGICGMAAVVVLGPVLLAGHLLARVWLWCVRQGCRPVADGDDWASFDVGDEAVRFGTHRVGRDDVRAVDAFLLRLGSFAAAGEESYFVRVRRRSGTALGGRVSTYWGDALDPLRGTGLLREHRLWFADFGLLWPLVALGVGLWTLVLLALA